MGFYLVILLSTSLVVLLFPAIWLNTLMDTNKHLKPGLSHQMEFTVEERHTASHIGSGRVKVLATPWMIAFMEITSRTLLDMHLPDSYSSVGTLVNVRHLAPTPLGSKVHAQVNIEKVEGNKITLSVSVSEGEVEVGKGAHERYVIDVDRFLKRVNKLDQ